MANRDNYFEHIFYEFHMFAYTYKLLDDINCGLKIMSEEEHNAVVESFYIHLRSIVKFFGTSKMSDDIIARDTIDNKFLSSVNSFIITNSARNDFINKGVCHISKMRKDWGKDFDVKCMDAFGMSKDVINSVNQYLKVLDKKHVSVTYASDLQVDEIQHALKQLQRDYNTLKTSKTNLIFPQSITSTVTTSSSVSILAFGEE